MNLIWIRLRMEELGITPERLAREMDWPEYLVVFLLDGKWPMIGERDARIMQRVLRVPDEEFNAWFFIEDLIRRELVSIYQLKRIAATARALEAKNKRNPLLSPAPPAKDDEKPGEA